MSVLIAGCGYTGVRVAEAFQREGKDVSAFARNPQSSSRLESLSITPIPIDLNCEITLPSLISPFAVACYFVPPPNDGTQDPLLSRFLDWLQRGEMPEKIVYISTSGVYGDHRGEWVTEDAVLKPLNDRSRRRLDAEQQLLCFSQKHKVPVIIFRVPGIYGPGRIPLTRISNGQPILNESEAPFSNRIHVDDLVAAIRLSVIKCNNTEIFNISDGCPGSMTDYFNQIADIYSLPRLPQCTLEEAKREMSPALLSYFSESRKLNIEKAKDLLGYKPQYPILSEALQQIRDMD